MTSFTSAVFSSWDSHSPFPFILLHRRSLHFAWLLMPLSMSCLSHSFLSPSSHFSSVPFSFYLVTFLFLLAVQGSSELIHTLQSNFSCFYAQLLAVLLFTVLLHLIFLPFRGTFLPNCCSKFVYPPTISFSPSLLFFPSPSSIFPPSSEKQTAPALNIWSDWLLILSFLYTISLRASLRLGIFLSSLHFSLLLPISPSSLTFLFTSTFCFPSWTRARLPAWQKMTAFQPSRVCLKITGTSGVKNCPRRE